MKEMDVKEALDKAISKAIVLLKKDDVVAIPTETVYGLAGNIYSQKAIEKIFYLKNRPHFNPLIVHLASQNQLDEVAHSIPFVANKLASAFWPGPLTLVLQKKECISDLVTGGKSTVAVRVPNHPVAQKLLSLLSFPLAAPSANPFKRISSTTAAHVFEYFGDELHVIDGGSCDYGLESTIVGFEKEEPVVYRLGSISVEEIELVVGKVRIATLAEGKEVSAPGMLSKHYAPKTKFVLTDDLESEILKRKGLRIGVIQNQGKEVDGAEVLIYHDVNLNFKEASKFLYASLHELDAKGLDIIVAQKFEEKYLGRTLNDRLLRASK